MRSNIKTISLALLVMALWGSLFTVVKIGYGAFNISSSSISGIIMFASVRFIISGLVVCAFSFFRKEKIEAPKGKSIAIKKHIVPDIISTDITKNSGYKRGGRYGLTMCISVAKQLGMTEEDIFRAVTSVPAKALDKSEEWGCLKEGRTADIAVFDYTEEAFDLIDNSGTNIRGDKGYKCVLTISDGEVVYRG
ncbi:MAG: amidohydrolase family protein [Clostridia bacterium]|nr:amidohydrolase family protein [Clostridia bacterium]